MGKESSDMYMLFMARRVEPAGGGGDEGVLSEGADGVVASRVVLSVPARGG